MRVWKSRGALPRRDTLFQADPYMVVVTAQCKSCKRIFLYLQDRLTKYRVYCSKECRPTYYAESARTKRRREIQQGTIQRPKVIKRPMTINFVNPKSTTDRYVCGCGGDYAAFPVDHICELAGEVNDGRLG